MQKHVVFLVHGMGDFEAGWASATMSMLKTCYERFEISKDASFDDRFDLKEVTYNHIFEERRIDWETERGRINAILVANGLTDNAVNRLLDFADATSGQDFMRSHVLDVLMYRFMPQIADHIRRFVQKEILTVTEASDALIPPIWSIIGHSLGTAVVHDTLHAMFTHPVGNELLSHTRKPEVVATVSNVCRVLWNDGDIFERSTVYPHPDRTRSMCQTFLNFQHPLDPFARVRSFHPPKGPRRQSDNFEDYVFKRIHKDDITHWNVHGFEHYLANPTVHVAIFRALLWKKAISETELQTQKTTYRSSRIAELVSVAKTLEKFSDTPADGSSWAEITESILRFRKLVLEREKAQ